ncbi:hypothetical protein NRH57_001079 [Providencia rettgeri]|nr:hypothetical protein [Providencia rettgeri]
MSGRFQLIKSEVPLITLVTAMSYFLIYFYHYGYADFWGYPKEFISIDISSILSVGVGFFSALLIAFFNLRFFSESPKPTFLEGAIYSSMALVAICFVFGYYLFRINDDFYNSKILYLCVFFIVITPFAFYGSFKQFFSEERNNIFVYISCLFCLMVLFSYSVGWVFALSKPDIYSYGGGTLISRYGDYYVVGYCNKEKANYELVSINTPLKLKPLLHEGKEQIKICFRNSTIIH